jgi:uncharacterized membrane protein YeiH
MFFYTLEVLGTILFAISGALSACRKNYDLSSVIVIAFIAGNGGGTMRDLLIGATPVFWIEQPAYIIISALAALSVFLIAEKVDFSRLSFLIADAIGLGIFAIAGAEKTLLMHLPGIVAVIMGVLTAVGGGAIRDMLCGDMPLIFKPEIYATAALAGASIFVVFYLFLPDHRIASIACATTVILIRLGTIRYGWTIPTFATIRGWLKFNHKKP